MNKGFFGFSRQPQLVVLPVVLFDDTVRNPGGQLDFDASLGIDENFIKLEIQISGRTTDITLDSNTLLITINNDITDADYFESRHYYYSGGHSGITASNRYIGLLGSSKNAGDTGSCIITIFDPSSLLQKDIIALNLYRSGAGNVVNNEYCMQWELTKPIDRLTFTLLAGNFAQESRCVILGYKKVWL